MASEVRRNPCFASVEPFTTRRKQSTVTGSNTSFRPAQLRFAVPAHIAHPRWRVSQARNRWAADHMLSGGLDVHLRFSFLISKYNANFRFPLRSSGSLGNLPGFSPPIAPMLAIGAFPDTRGTL